MPSDVAAIPPGGLLTRLEILVNLVADRRGLALDRQGRLAPAEARLLCEAVELGEHATPQMVAVQLLSTVAEAIGLLHVRGDRLEATSLRHPWAQLGLDVRAGLLYAAWCHRVPWSETPGDVPEPHVCALREGRSQVLRLLFELPVAAEVQFPELVGPVADRLDVPVEAWLTEAVAAVFVDPLVALGVATLSPPHPAPPGTFRLSPMARTVVGSALIAAGEAIAQPGPGSP